MIKTKKAIALFNKNFVLPYRESVYNLSVYVVNCLKHNQELKNKNLPTCDFVNLCFQDSKSANKTFYDIATFVTIKAQGDSFLFTNNSPHSIVKINRAELFKKPVPGAPLVLKNQLPSGNLLNFNDLEVNAQGVYFCYVNELSYKTWKPADNDKYMERIHEILSIFLEKKIITMDHEVFKFIEEKNSILKVLYTLFNIVDIKVMHQSGAPEWLEYLYSFLQSDPNMKVDIMHKVVKKLL
eukprot:TRINITY_DN813_c0_g1_i1.p1 TRINITY_DN813_c0_g1~~TRINITY_DN813_c0_g1_i1.p1  ORF type:complete len:239 (+),score=23.15 TRINITY_DN813_c0_g1_i1:775-1491(+)